MLNKNEAKIIESFRLVKNDIMALQRKMTELAQNQERMMEWIQDTRDKQAKLFNEVGKMKAKAKASKATKTVVVKKQAAAVSKPKVKTITKIKTVTKRAKLVFVASKEGKKFHVESCPFGKNIKPILRFAYI